MSSLHPIDVLGELQIEVDGSPASVRGEGDRVVIEVPDLRTGQALLQNGLAGPDLSTRAERLGQVHGALQEADVQAEVRVRGEPFARIGARTQPGALSRILRLGGVELRPRRSLLGSLRENAGAAFTVGAAVGLLSALVWARRPRD